MCGINGFNFKDEYLINKMYESIKNRGPDASGTYLDDNASLGHTRLSIIDTDPRSNQPFEYKDLVIAYNGEIYNYLELSKKIINKGIELKTKSDTEIIIILFDLYGIKSFKMLSGIFAISIWHKKKKIFYIIRDIVGIKPLYYKFNIKSNDFYFSSSIYALKNLNLKNEISDNALYFYQNLGRNDSTESFIKGIHKILPGELIIFSESNGIKKKKVSKI